MTYELIKYMKWHKQSLENDLNNPDLKGSEYLDIEAKLSLLYDILGYDDGLDKSRQKMIEYTYGK